MRALALLVFALVVGCPALAQAQVTSVEIVAYGIDTADEQFAWRDRQGFRQSTSTNFRNISMTADIPAEIGLRFGIDYKVTGSSHGQSVSLRRVVVFPPVGLRSPVVSTQIDRTEDNVTAQIGETHHVAYRFDDPWELVPGPWVIQIWEGDSKLAEQRFSVFVW